MAEKHVFRFGKDANGNNVTEVAGDTVDKAKWVTGGKGANQACAAALAGADTVMAGAIGDDAASSVATTRLEDAGVDLSHVQQVAGPTGLAVVEWAEFLPPAERPADALTLRVAATARVDPSETVAQAVERVLGRA